MRMPETGDMNNRKEKRFGERHDILIKDPDLGWNPGAPIKINAHTSDISVSGARLTCKTDFPVGRVLHIVLHFNRTDQILCVDGEVKWTRKDGKGKCYEIGVEFLHTIPDTVVSLIGHFYGKDVGLPTAVA
jgi:PilZ domain